MKNITLSMDDELLEKGRLFAQRNHTTFNQLVRDLVQERVSRESKGWLVEAFSLMDRAKARKKSRKWKREDLYRV